MSEVERIRQEKMKKLQDQAQMPRAPITVTDSNFEEILKKYDAVVVDLWASWCMPCKMLEPTVEEIAKEYEGRLKVCSLNIDNAQSIAAQYSVMSIPTLALFKNGQVVHKTVGALPKDTIIEQFSNHIS